MQSASMSQAVSNHSLVQVADDIFEDLVVVLGEAA